MRSKGYSQERELQEEITGFQRIEKLSCLSIELLKAVSERKEMTLDMAQRQSIYFLSPISHGPEERRKESWKAGHWEN